MLREDVYLIFLYNANCQTITVNLKNYYCTFRKPVLFKFSTIILKHFLEIFAKQPKAIFLINPNF